MFFCENGDCEIERTILLGGTCGSVGSLKYRPEIPQMENILSTVELWQ